jgi:hypothetical protein
LELACVSSDEEAGRIGKETRKKKGQETKCTYAAQLAAKKAKPLMTYLPMAPSEARRRQTPRHTASETTRSSCRCGPPTTLRLQFAVLYCLSASPNGAGTMLTLPLSCQAVNGSSKRAGMGIIVGSDHKKKLQARDALKARPPWAWP